MDVHVYIYIYICIFMYIYSCIPIGFIKAVSIRTASGKDPKMNRSTSKPRFLRGEFIVGL